VGRHTAMELARWRWAIERREERERERRLSALQRSWRGGAVCLIGRSARPSFVWFCLSCRPHLRRPLSTPLLFVIVRRPLWPFRPSPFCILPTSSHLASLASSSSLPHIVTIYHLVSGSIQIFNRRPDFPILTHDPGHTAHGHTPTSLFSSLINILRLANFDRPPGPSSSRRS
jgi:hypothetical protein